ncbi:ATPase [Corynebacterium lactis RW2-5]|uniref:ATPase n=2 Tax=Corynebacterium lactis TaxID=1231000 RepID=A0A0K2H037_9CORY|nr:ATPase [Corynebacterium lactis RW2-5]
MTHANAPVDAEMHATVERAYAELGKVVVGQEHLCKQLFIAMLAGGHVLLEGVPGVAKTLAVSTFAKVMGGSYSRIQFTPDLVPSDIVGTRIFRQDTSEFLLEHGPVMANIVLADEINRAPAKVQSALLEVMAEHQVSIAGNTSPVPEPFLVLATQNPIENQGVYPLPEAQRDRFLFKILVGYPSPSEEREIVYRMGATPPVAQQVLSPEQVRDMQRATREVFVHHSLIDYVVAVVELTRSPSRADLKDVDRWLAYGASPRATLGTIAAARAHALFSGRDYVVPNDVVSVLPDVLRHRLVLSYEGLADGITPEHVIDQVLSRVRLPQSAEEQQS